MIGKKYDQHIITLALVKYSGVNPRTFDLLINIFGSLDEILFTDESKFAGIAGISAETARKLSRADRYLEKSEEYVKALEQKNVRIITRFDEQYPSHLLEINDPPPLLYIRGRMPAVNSKIISLIGTERATQPGIALTAKIAKALVSKKIQVVSSLKPGIDIAVHLGARACGGSSFAVIDKGFDNIKSDEEVPLAIDIIQSGGIISEYPPEIPFHQIHFQQSNRLIAGIAQAVIVTEFYEGSSHVYDILEYSHQIGKLSFIIIDPKQGALADEISLALAVKHGAIIMSGLEKIDDIIKALV